MRDKFGKSLRDLETKNAYGSCNIPTNLLQAINRKLKTFGTW